MAERQTGVGTPIREHEQGLEWSRPAGSGITRYSGGSPLRMLQRFADEIDRVFDEAAFGGRLSSPRWSQLTTDAWAPSVEVFQKNSELTIKADLPGLKKDEVSVDITDNAVTIQGERKREQHDERDGYFRSERSYGNFCRVIPLPEGAISEQAKATFRDGVLQVTMPAPPATKGRRLEITEGQKK
jgi:HSP20 family protein